MNTRALIPLMPLLTGCLIVSTGDDVAEDSTSGDGDGDPSGDGDGDPTTTGDGDGDPTTTGDGDGDGDMWCGLDEGPDEPWFTLAQFGTALESGGDVAVECGFQGFFMIEIAPSLGGFVPTDSSVPFSVTLDVEGFNLGPDGHFAAGDFNIYVACCEDDGYGSCYYLTHTFQLFPPDGIPDLSVIHGAPATLTVTMDTVDGQVTQELDVSMWAMEQDMEWQYCGYYGYPDVDPLEVSTLPIPG